MIRLTKWVPARRPIANSTGHDNALHSAERMRLLLDRERMRSDRGNSTFALVTLAFSRRLSPAEKADVGRIFRNRIRATDDAGLLDKARIGILLPETPYEGAWKLADDVVALLPTELPRPKCEVYVYPSDTDSLDQPVAGDDAQAPRDDSREARPMEVLFVKALPRWKRALDLIGAGTALLVLSPVILVAALAIKLTSPGPILFRQRRDTAGGRPFMIYKFRTMLADAESRKAALLKLSEQDGPAFKLTNDPRVTPVGRILRVTSIDEIPQLINVLKGDMSLVGPRPLPSNESALCRPWERRRLDVTAGITCIWQARARSSVPFAEWMRMDLRYIRARSIGSDLKLMMQTVPAVLLRRGAR